MKKSAADGLKGASKRPPTVAADATRVTPRQSAPRQATIGPAPSRAERALNVARNIPVVDAVANAAQAGADLRRGRVGAALIGAAAGVAAAAGVKKGVQAVNAARDAARVGRSAGATRGADVLRRGKQAGSITAQDQRIVESARNFRSAVNLPASEGNRMVRTTGNRTGAILSSDAHLERRPGTMAQMGEVMYGRKKK